MEIGKEKGKMRTLNTPITQKTQKTPIFRLLRAIYSNGSKLIAAIAI